MMQLFAKAVPPSLVIEVGGDPPDRLTNSAPHDVEVMPRRPIIIPIALKESRRNSDS
jgi:hypothetical protein